MSQKPKIIFFDNEIRNWGEHTFKDMKEHEDDITFHLVDDTIPNDFSKTFVPSSVPNELEENKGYIQSYMDHFAGLGNTYALYLKDQLTKGPKQYAKILKQEGYGRGFPTNGFDAFIPMLEGLPANSQNMDDPNNTYILSDWDRTVTAAEGIYFGEKFELLDEIRNGNVNVDDIINYIMGGPERLERVKNSLAGLLNKNILFIVLTHNPASSKTQPSREIYLEILGRLFNLPKNVIDENILFSSYDFVEYGTRPYKNKSVCNTIVSRFLKYCDTMNKTGGKRRRQRKTKGKKSRKNKRKTRSHRRK
jgi:hypothetical protein